MTSSLDNPASLNPPVAGNGEEGEPGNGKTSIRFIIESNGVAPVGLCTWGDLGGEM